MEQIVVGLSGGADSVCLLRVLQELQHVFDFRLQAVHVNHQIRGEEVILSKDTDKVVTMIVPTNEELAIARETVRLVK